MRPQASRSAPDQRRPPTTRATLPSPTPPLGPAPPFRHSCAGRNPCDLKLPVSAPDQRRPAATRATLPAPTPPPVLPLLSVIPAQAANPHATSSPVSASPDATHATGIHATSSFPHQHSRHAPCTHPTPAVRRRPRGEGSPLLSLRDISPRRAGGEGIRTQSPHPQSGGRAIQRLPNPRPPRRHP